ncbi:hypothetical protein [Janthinobacterium sp. GW458P]|uniref:hypothetical protein n=1 Tax=Janthinobacterium sp. GW458P TaxID=1981504 RepID=UPI001554EE2A|nr:hypothetical protein [Janthinobacterium sp. GW458P]MBE3027580.1 hypothetical protein [Janthinobacterium sp. GW458P]
MTTVGAMGGALPLAAGGAGGVVQAERTSATAPIETSRLPRVNKRRVNKLRVNNIGMRMWILMIEALVAFFLLVFIVWWTMYSGKKPAPPARKQVSDEKDAAEKLK